MRRNAKRTGSRLTMSNCLLLILLSLALGSSQKTDDSGGCTAPFLLPNKPFIVVWNVPSDECGKLPLNLTDWGIVTNKDDRFLGNEMTIFYTLGDWPSFGKNGTAINGGIPQVANREKHFQKAAKDIQNLLPNKDFDGLSVIDFESWRPFFNHNFDSLEKYRDWSVTLVKARYPTWTNKTQIWAEAAREFEAAARLFMEGTLQEARYLRPYGKWGYYGFPRCYGVSPSHETCAYPGTSSSNDAIGWLFKSSTGLFPRIYTDPTTPLKPRAEFVRQQINETLRVQAKFNELYRPILPYSMCMRNQFFFNEQDLDISIKEVADMGAAGVVLWGSSHLFHNKDECLKLQTYIRTLLGPFVKKLMTFTSACSMEHCSGHGRCVRKDYEAMTQMHLAQNNKAKCRKPWTEYTDVSRKMSEYTDDSRRTSEYADASRKEMTKSEEIRNGYANSKPGPYDNYVCHCLPGWEGTRCSKPV